MTVINITHPPALSALLLILSASRFLVSDFPLLVPAPFLSSVPLHGMTFPFLSNRNHNVDSFRSQCFQNNRSAISPFCTAVFNNNNDNNDNNNNKDSNKNHWHKQSESREDWAELNGSRVETRSQMTNHCSGNANHSKADTPPPPPPVPPLTPPSLCPSVSLSASHFSITVHPM